MTTQEQCEAILKKILELANDGKPVTISADWGGFALTIAVAGSHTHVGDDTCGTWEQLIGQLYDVLHGGPGLSWVVLGVKP